MLGCARETHIVPVQQRRLHSGQRWLVPLVVCSHLQRSGIASPDSYINITSVNAEQWPTGLGATQKHNLIFTGWQPLQPTGFWLHEGHGIVDIASHGMA